MDLQKPSVGRIVHYYRHSQVDERPFGPFAAIVTAAGSGMPLMAVNLAVFDGETGMFFAQGVRFDESREPLSGTWRWPPRV